MRAFVAEPYFVHESSYVDTPAEIGDGTKIWHFSHILAGTKIGAGCTIGQNVMIGPRVRVGDRVKIQNNVSVYEGVELEDDVFCGPSVVFTNVSTPRSGTPRNRTEFFLPTIVKRGATLGANSTIVCGHTIGEFAFVGAGAVVTKDVPAYAMVFGNPARLRGYACECGLRLSLVPPVNGAAATATCEGCRRSYQYDDAQVLRRIPCNP